MSKFSQNCCICHVVFNAFICHNLIQERYGFTSKSVLPAYADDLVLHWAPQHYHQTLTRFLINLKSLPVEQQFCEISFVIKKPTDRTDSGLHDSCQ